MGVHEALCDIACNKAWTNIIDLNLIICRPMHTDLHPLLKSTDAFSVFTFASEGSELCSNKMSEHEHDCLFESLHTTWVKESTFNVALKNLCH